MIRRPLGRLLFAALVLVSVQPVFAASAEEAYYGFDVDLLAKALAHLTTYRTQYGEQDGRIHFDQWLASAGQSREKYDAAYDAWWKRFKADSTGQIESRFHLLNSQYVQQMNYSDVRRHDQDVRAGVTLDQYARLTVALTRPPVTDPAAIDRLLRQQGLAGQAQWTKANDAWTKAMHDDTTLALVQQYAALYQKYAGSSFVKEQQDTTARILAEHNKQPPPSATPHAGLPGIDPSIAKLSSSTASERWTAAREVLRQCSLWAGPGRREASDSRAAVCGTAALRERVLPVVLDAIDHHCDDTLNAGTNMLDFLGDNGLKDATVKAAVERALHRDRERLARLQAEFAPIQDKAVPERIMLRSRIDGYQAAVRDLESAIAEW